MHEKKEQPEKSADHHRRALSPSRRPDTRAPRAAGSVSPQTITVLQRTIGNAAVARMIEQRREAASPDGQPVPGSLVPEVLHSAGLPLAEPVRAEMEERLGADFSDVRVHDDRTAQRSATEIGARAYTSGHHVVLRDGVGDRHTLAHELVHVMQQRLGPVSGTDNGSGLSVSDPSDRFEREAEQTARRVTPGRAPAPAPAPAQPAMTGQTGSVQRAPGTAVQRVAGEDAAPSQQGTAPVDPLSAYEAATYRPGDAGAVGTVTPGVRSAALQKIVWEQHWAPISAVCKKYHYTIAVRETGEYSINRIMEGAKPKPHTILEKSIKDSSVEKEYGPGTGRPQTDPAMVLRWLHAEELDGFVGHWSGAGLIGVRIDNPSEEVLSLGIVQRGAGDAEYVPISVLEPGGGRALTTLKREVPAWKQQLYTGDYDLHEAYSTLGAMGGGGQIAEASTEKVNLLNRLNAGIAGNSSEAVRRGGTAALGTHGLHMENSPYAMFQHGDQATYWTNQILEAQAQPEALRPVVASLVRAVATESNEPMGWCRWGEWYVTDNRDEHAALRERWGLVPPNTWSREAVRRVDADQYRTARYTT
ncbi:eCIS core domain-containing protein [Actinoalloteichus fjordicus]|uniref:DUF4157 family protein n=1 Tax=Actinoalloteichus fjordicus TaxID=1612552 RepID=A0AAC9PRC8_9PSEU|nr:DUF4157 domain-containing protein [Actinoalloteichus fjordicus]APU14179.1 putative DUF4157 family protein [Actinoalloteichus fjordicus]